MDLSSDIIVSHLWHYTSMIETLPVAHLTIFIQFSLVQPVYVGEMGRRCFRKWFVACSAAPRPYLNQRWIFIDHISRNILQWNSIEINQISMVKVHLHVTLSAFCPRRQTALLIYMYIYCVACKAEKLAVSDIDRVACLFPYSTSQTCILSPRISGRLCT